MKNLPKSCGKWVDLLTEEDREFTEAEAKQFDDMEAETKELDEKIHRQEKGFENLQRSKPKRELLKRRKLLNKSWRSHSVSPGQSRPDWVETTLRVPSVKFIKEAVNEARSAGITDMSDGGVALPSWMMKAMTSQREEGNAGKSAYRW